MNPANDVHDLPERTWPKNALPTPEQWLEWFDRCSPEDRVVMAARILKDRRTAWRCFEMEHDGELRHLRAALREATP